MQIASWVSDYVTASYENNAATYESPGAEAWYSSGVAPGSIGASLSTYLEPTCTSASDHGSKASGIVAFASKAGKRRRDAPCSAWIDAGFPQLIPNTGSVRPRLQRRTDHFQPWADRAAHKCATNITGAIKRSLLALAKASATATKDLNSAYPEHAVHTWQHAQLRGMGRAVTALYITRTSSETPTPGAPTTDANKIWIVVPSQNNVIILFEINEDVIRPSAHSVLYTF